MVNILFCIFVIIILYMYTIIVDVQEIEEQSMYIKKQKTPIYTVKENNDEDYNDYRTAALWF